MAYIAYITKIEEPVLDDDDVPCYRVYTTRVGDDPVTDQVSLIPLASATNGPDLVDAVETDTGWDLT